MAIQWAYNTRTGEVIPYDIRMDWKRNCWSAGPRIENDPYVVEGFSYRQDAEVARDIYAAYTVCERWQQGVSDAPCPSCGTPLRQTKTQLDRKNQNVILTTLAFGLLAVWVAWWLL